ncbi:VWA domain-containing protein [Pseudomonas borbori]|uniref:Ca-activated chloride channel family protein n=1 Tax=Pseudomonas borbori TaxID=289003 RepID=A0A1I5K5W7_9PSED|nr:VWA domain-containing protein [Pseudomonas borbori]SFO80133.1 Ca-activated chloride channel family protein [Pseudomonas borbori]
MIEDWLAGLWPHWLRPYWLLAVPLLAGLLWQLWHREKRAGRWQLLLPPAFHAALLSGGRGRSSRLPWIALGLAWLLALLALLGPSWQRLEQSNLKPADPLVVLLELTPQMLASDSPPNRLEQAKRKLLDLLQARRDAQTAIVVFAGSAHTLVPLSDDLATSRNLLESLKPSIMPEPGRRADLALGKALQLLEQAGQGRGRILLIGSGLDQQERLGIRQALGNRDVLLHMLGIGSAEGAPIVQENGALLKDAQGAILIPRLDSADLARFARQIGGRYRQASLDDRDLHDLGLFAAPEQLRSGGEQTHLQAWADQGHWLLLPLLLLAACAGRRGWLFCLPLLLGVPQSSYALSFDDLWWRADQQGQRLLEAQRPVEAAARFADPQWQGLALYQAGDYPAAAERFARGDNAVAHYNRGNALARSNELEAALDAYNQALEMQPDLLPAQTNKALIEQLLEQSQHEQNQQQNQESEADSTSTPPPQTGPPQPDADKPPPASGQSAPGDQEQAPSQPTPGDSDAPTPSEPEDELQGEEQIASAAPALDGERRQALEQWLRQIPDEPGELLRRKFWYEQQQRQEQTR